MSNFMRNNNALTPQSRLPAGSHQDQNGYKDYLPIHNIEQATQPIVESRVPYQDDFYLLDVVGG